VDASGVLPGDPTPLSSLQSVADDARSAAHRMVETRVIGTDGTLHGPADTSQQVTNAGSIQ
jgi:hypothetical protein